MKRFHLLHIDKCQDMLYIIIDDFFLINSSLFLGLFEVSGKSKFFNILKACILADRDAFLSDDFYSIIVGRIMAGRDHESAIHFIEECAEVHHFCTAASDVIHISTAVSQSAACSFADLLGARAHVIADAHGFG